MMISRLWKGTENAISDLGICFHFGNANTCKYQINGDVSRREWWWPFSIWTDTSSITRVSRPLKRRWILLIGVLWTTLWHYFRKYTLYNLIWSFLLFIADSSGPGMTLETADCAVCCVTQAEPLANNSSQYLSGSDNVTGHSLAGLVRSEKVDLQRLLGSVWQFTKRCAQDYNC